MPWFRSEHIIPPMNQEITTFKAGVRETKSYGPFDIYSSEGKMSKEFPEWWARTSDLPDPPEAKDKGLDHYFPKIQEEIMRPKIVEGKRPKGPEVRAEGAWDER